MYVYCIYTDTNNFGRTTYLLYVFTRQSLCVHKTSSSIRHPFCADSDNLNLIIKLSTHTTHAHKQQHQFQHQTVSQLSTSYYV